MGKPVLLSQANVTELEAEAVARAVTSGWVAPLGPEVDGFEADICLFTGAQHAVALSSGTAALHLALDGGRVFFPRLLEVCQHSTRMGVVGQSEASPLFKMVRPQRMGAGFSPRPVSVVVQAVRRWNHLFRILLFRSYSFSFLLFCSASFFFL